MAPSNYRSDAVGYADGMIFKVIVASARYEYERIKMFATTYLLFTLIVISLIFLIFIEEIDHTFRFPVPVIYMVLLLLGEIATIFPVQWASGIEAYKVYERCIILSDWTSFLLILFIVYYLIGWIKIRFNIKGISDERKKYQCV